MEHQELIGLFIAIIGACFLWHVVSDKKETTSKQEPRQPKYNQVEYYQAPAAPEAPPYNQPAPQYLRTSAPEPYYLAPEAPQYHQPAPPYHHQPAPARRNGQGLNLHGGIDLNDVRTALEIVRLLKDNRR